MIDISLFDTAHVTRYANGNIIMSITQGGGLACFALPWFRSCRDGALMIYSPTNEWEMFLWYEGVIAHAAILAHGVWRDAGEPIKFVRMPSGVPDEVLLDVNGYVAVLSQVASLLGEDIDVIHCTSCFSGCGANSFAARLSSLTPACVVIAPVLRIKAYLPNPANLHRQRMTLKRRGRLRVALDYSDWIRRYVGGTVLADCAPSGSSFSPNGYRYFRNGEEASSPDHWIDQIRRSRVPPSSVHFAGTLEYFAAGGSSQFG